MSNKVYLAKYVERRSAKINGCGGTENTCKYVNDYLVKLSQNETADWYCFPFCQEDVSTTDTMRARPSRLCMKLWKWTGPLAGQIS